MTTRRDLNNVSGDVAKWDAGSIWPDNIPITAGTNTSVRNLSQNDTRVCWLKVTVDAELAERWQETIHRDCEKPQSPKRFDEIVEGVHRTVDQPKLIETRHGTAPAWWKPPSRFRLTESMRWSTGANYARSLYSAYDASTMTLWIFDDDQQHGQLWPRGNVPEGTRFTSAEPAVPQRDQ